MSTTGNLPPATGHFMDAPTLKPTLPSLMGLLDDLAALLSALEEHRCMSAKVRELLHNGGAGPNRTQLQQCDEMLRKMAGLPEGSHE